MLKSVQNYDLSDKMAIFLDKKRSEIYVMDRPGDRKFYKIKSTNIKARTFKVQFKLHVNGNSKFQSENWTLADICRPKLSLEKQVREKFWSTYGFKTLKFTLHIYLYCETLNSEIASNRIVYFCYNKYNK